MRFPWVIVGNTGYDVEEIDHPRSHEMDCPSCERHVRFVEKELIKNLRVFGVPLVGVERGRRVFECPHCKVCVEPPAGESAAEAKPGSGADPQIEAIEARLRKVEDEIWLWNSRAKSAADKGVRDLEFEALEWKTKSEREAALLREKLATLRSAPPAATSTTRDASTTGKQPAIVARRGGEIVDRAADDEFAALKAKIAKRRDTESSEETSSDRTEPGSATKPADTLVVDHPHLEPPSTDAAIPPSAIDKNDVDVDGDFEALKAKLGAKRDGGASPADATRDAEYQSLRDEMKNAPAEPVTPSTPIASDAKPAAPPGESSGGPPPVSGDDDDDPVAALKKKLRRK